MSRHTAIYSRLAEPEPVIEAGLRALERGRAVVIPGVRNNVLATGGRFMPREWLTLFSGRLLRPQHGDPPTDRRSQRNGDSRDARTHLGLVVRRRTLALVVSRLPVGSTRVRGFGIIGVPPDRRPSVEGTSRRPSQHRGRRRAPARSSPSPRMPSDCTRSARSRSGPRPMARVPSSSAMKPRSGRWRGWAACTWHRGCTRPTKSCSRIWPAPPFRASRSQPET